MNRGERSMSIIEQNGSFYRDRLCPGAKPFTWSTSRLMASRRDVFVLLPPSCRRDKHRRYPVVYALHG
jgi:hypothetical protein